MDSASYIEERNGGYYVAGTRVSLDSIVHEFRRGAAPETILRAFPLIGSLERVYGAITYYLAHRQQVDEYLQQRDALWAEARSKQQIPADLRERLVQARKEAARQQ